MSEPPLRRLDADASCGICGHLGREPPHPQSVVIARATFPAFADRATHGCIICALICNTAVSRSSTWRSVAQEKLVISVYENYAPNESSKELEVSGDELLKPCLLDQAGWSRNSRHLFSAALYSPLGKTTRHYTIIVATTD